MTTQLPERRRRRRHSAPGRRLARAVGLGESPPRLAIVIVALVVTVAAGMVALAGSPPTIAVEASPSARGTSIAPSTAGDPTPRPIAPGTPAIATPTPRSNGIVADRIRIERLGIDLRIVAGDGIDAPMNKAAHYPDTSWPDGNSNIYIYGHAQKGMFLSLWDAKLGDVIVLELVDGTDRHYVVITVKPTVAWNALEYLDPTPTEQLTLQTSTSNTPTAPRFIVIAEPAP